MPDKPSSFRDTAVAPAQMSPGLSALLVDDEAPALSELTFLLRQDHRIGEIRTASSGADALRALEAHPVDVVLYRQWVSCGFDDFRGKYGFCSQTLLGRWCLESRLFWRVWLLRVKWILYGKYGNY